ncbi:MAG: DUF1641 domain-containing protein [Anaerolineales bacterium]|nr:DUF1641 domain-containing protein [Chloroflexota bacterium]MBL6979937.1 DUF1641 domain-containing protein [Anaerolineales bacterium]
MAEDLALLHQKVDLLTEQVAALTSHAEIQQRKQREFDELKNDAIPIVNHMIKLSIDELADIGTEFEVEDLFFLLKRVIRNTHMFLAVFDRFEALMGIADETELLGKQVFNFAVEQLDQFERDGYFDFARESWLIMERIVTEFSKEDVRALGDNVVTILNTVRTMTQPEIMALANNAVGAIKEEIPETEKVSTWKLLRELGDPKVRRGMVRMINLLKALDEQAN